MKYVIAICLLLAACGKIMDLAKDFSVSKNGVTIEGTVKPEAKVTAREYKTAISLLLNKTK